MLMLMQILTMMLPPMRMLMLIQHSRMLLCKLSTNIILSQPTLRIGTRTKNTYKGNTF